MEPLPDWVMALLYRDWFTIEGEFGSNDFSLTNFKDDLRRARREELPENLSSLHDVWLTLDIDDPEEMTELECIHCGKRLAVSLRQFPTARKYECYGCRGKNSQPKWWRTASK